MNNQNLDDQAIAWEPSVFDRITWVKNDVVGFLKRNIQYKIIRFIGGVPADFDCCSVTKAKKEMEYVWGPSLKGGDGSNMQHAIMNDILDVLAVFSNQGHSGSSAAYAIPYIKKLLNQEPIAPLTGEDWEWNEIDENGTYQNNRMSHVFKNKDGAYDINGKVFGDKIEDGGYSYWTGSESRVPVEFPYTASTIYIDRETGEEIKQN